MTISELDADVVVVGGGAAGLVAAAVARSVGARVVLLERAAQIGGTATHSVGEFWIPNNRHLRERAIPDPEADCLRLMARLSYPARYDPGSPTLGLTDLEYDLLVTFYRRSSEAIEYLEGIGALHSKISPAAYGDPLGHPEYHADLPENRVPQGRHLIVDNGDPAFGLRGEAYVEQLGGYLESSGVSVLTEHHVVGVERDGTGRVTGVLAETTGGTRRVTATRGVIFASGGFGHSRADREAFLPGPVDAVAAVTTNTGDFLRIGQELGAELGNMTAAYLGDCAFELGLAADRLPVLTHFPFGDSMLWVNTAGRRVVNEKGVFTERARAHYDWDVAARRFGNRVLIQVFDRAVLDFPAQRYPMPPAGTPADHVLVAPDLPELARLVDERLAKLAPHTGGLRLTPDFAATLQASIERFNDGAAVGTDPDFGRGETPIQTCYEQSLHPGLPNPTLAPLSDTGPYAAMLIGNAMFDTAGGPVITPDARVLDVHHRPIPGLFAAGCCTASPGGQAYWSGGGPIGIALTFGYIAAKTAAAA